MKNRLFLIPSLAFLLSLPGQAPAQCVVNPSSIVSAFAGTGVYGYTGDGGAAVLAQFASIQGLCFDSAGNLYICDTGNYVVRKVSTSGVITTYAGNGTYGYSGDGGPATSATFKYPTFAAFDSQGNLYIADLSSFVIRKVDPTGTITTFAGTGVGGSSGNGGPALAANIEPYDLAIDQFDNIFFTEPGFADIRKITPAGTITAFAGVSGSFGYSGDGGPAVLAQLEGPESVAFDPGSASLFFWDDGNYVVRRVDSCGIITTVAGTHGSSGTSGDEGPALSAKFADVHGMTLLDGTVYLSDTAGQDLRTIDPCGIVHRLGGQPGIAGSTGDGGPASAANFYDNIGIAFDTSGNLFVGQLAQSRVREVAVNCSPTPTLTCMVVPTATPACTQPVGTKTPTSTPTITATDTPTPTPSSTPTITMTFTPTATFSPTWTCTNSPTSTPSCVPQVWPNPFNPQYAVNELMKIGCLEPGSTAEIYTLSGEKVIAITDSSFQYGSPFTAVWDGRNDKGVPVSSGIYYYLIRKGGQVTLRGKFLVVRSP